MEEKELKTSAKQRLFIILVAVVMVGSIIASYAAIVMGGQASSSSASDTTVDEAKVAQYEEAYNTKLKEFAEATKGDYDEFIKYKSEIKAYNEASANGGGVQIKDLKEGTGAEVTKDNYLAYYVGWCADESVFDSSFDNNTNPTEFNKILDPTLGMIEGWNAGVEGMKLGGIRRITISSELAYADQMEICGGYNKPLRFMVMAVEKKDPLESLANSLDEAYMRLQYAYYGVDYDSAAAAAEAEK